MVLLNCGGVFFIEGFENKLINFELYSYIKNNEMKIYHVTIFCILILIVCSCANEDQHFICNYYGYESPSFDEKVLSSGYSFNSNAQAIEIVDNILKEVGLVRNFEVISNPNVDNASALVYKNKRFILYNNQFMDLSDQITRNKWTSVSILAHEIGHHLQGHTISNSGNRLELELEADKFSGFVLAKMGASLQDAQSAILALASKNGTDTHPPRSKRLLAIANGYRDGTTIDNEKKLDNNTVEITPKIADADKDGIPNNKDKCPNSPGLFLFDGCPDSDGDGVPDTRDRCPTIAGKNYWGCPPRKDKNGRLILELAIRSVQFEARSSLIQPRSYEVLDQCAEILIKYPNYKIELSGYTDNRESNNESNKYEISGKRVKACFNYLLNKGVESSRISLAEYGDTSPIDTNHTREGRQRNRRVELKITLGK